MSSRFSRYIAIPLLVLAVNAAYSFDSHSVNFHTILMRPVLFHSLLMFTAFVLGFYLVYETIPDPSEDYAWQHMSAQRDTAENKDDIVPDITAHEADNDNTDINLISSEDDADNPLANAAADDAESVALDANTHTNNSTQAITIYGNSSRLNDPYLFETFKRKHNVTINIVPLPSPIDTKILSAADVIISDSARFLNHLAQQSALASLPENISRAHIAADVKQVGIDNNISRWVPLTRYAYAIFSFKKEKRDAAPVTEYEDLIASNKKHTLLINDSAAEDISSASFDSSDEAKAFKAMLLEQCDPAGVNASDETLLRLVSSDESAVAVAKVDAFIRLQYSGYAKDRAVSDTLNIHFPAKNNGTVIGVSGAAIGANARNPDGAQKLLNYLLSRAGQSAYAYKRMEYPVRQDASAFSGLAALGTFKENTGGIARATP